MTVSPYVGPVVLMLSGAVIAYAGARLLWRNRRMRPSKEVPIIAFMQMVALGLVLMFWGWIIVEKMGDQPIRPVSPCAETTGGTMAEQACRTAGVPAPP